jgi:ADP-ribosylglycohydrolase
MGLPPGSTTDDTAMARNLVRSLGERGGFDPEDLVTRHLAWLRTRPPDMGSLTGAVLRRVAAGSRAEDAARALWEERGPEISGGNGSVMYCAPLGAAYANRPAELKDLAPTLSALTHFDGRCRTACLAVTLAVATLVREEAPDVAARLAVSSVLPLEGGEELEFLVEEAGKARPVDGPDRGFCLFAAAIGLQSLTEGQAFEPALCQVISLGGDTDTNAAVAGALLGAALGHSALPSEWLGHLVDASGIESEAQRLVPLAASS